MKILPLSEVKVRLNRLVDEVRERDLGGRDARHGPSVVSRRQREAPARTERARSASGAPGASFTNRSRSRTMRSFLPSLS